LDVLRGLYDSLLTDSAAHVVWHPPVSQPYHLGAFAAGTTRLRDTESKIRQGLPPALFARLALRVAAQPRHVLARRRWESLIPPAEIGYVLTLGVARSVVPTANTPPGRSILAELEAWFVDERCVESWVDTELSNHRAHAFYLRAGYVEVTRDFGQVLLKKTFT